MIIHSMYIYYLRPRLAVRRRISDREYILFAGETTMETKREDSIIKPCSDHHTLTNTAKKHG